MPTDTPCRFLRFISMAALIVAASGILGATGQPVYAAVGDATLQWGAAKSEREKLRRRVTGGLRAVANRAERRDSEQVGGLWEPTIPMRPR
jgi:hypothetical protein